MDYNLVIPILTSDVDFTRASTLEISYIIRVSKCSCLSRVSKGRVCGYCLGSYEYKIIIDFVFIYS